ncbi:MAG TPA: spore coat U domain-containing protein [Variovorax sp.]|nr:spore coat U domain-containing protein [Variovorax sp.]
MIHRSLPATLPAAFLLAMLSGDLPAATRTADVSVSAGVVAQCTVAGGAGSNMPAALLDFGSRDALASGMARAQSPSGGSGALQVLCNSATVTPTLTLGTGAHAGGGSLRRLSGPGAVLVDYALYRDSARTQFIDASPFSLPGITAGVPYVLTLYGSLPVPGQASAEGSYADAVDVTVSY